MRLFPGRVRKLATSSRAPNPGSVESLSRRDRILILGYVAAVTVLSWGYLFYLDHQMSSTRQHDKMMMEMGMSMAMPWTTADIFFTFTMWVVMMVGMMAGSALPVMLLFAGAHARRGGGRAPFIVLIFGLGYLTVWVGFSACATLAQWALHHAAVLSPEMAAPSPRIGGAILCAAGVYQLTPSPLTPARPRATASCVHSRSSVAWTDACRQGERSTRDTGSEKTYRSSRRLRGPLSAIQCHLLEQMHLAKLQGRPIKTGSVCVRF